MTSVQENGPRRRRADAERNRVKVLEAARALFAEQGDDVYMDEVARRAGVGIGTLYRHFPSKEAMVEAAAQQRFGDIVSYYRTECRDSAEPLEALTMLLTHIGEVEARDRIFSRVVEITLGTETGPPDKFRADLEAELVDLVGKGHTSGAIRQDVEGADILSITCGLAAIVHRGSGDWRRYIDIVIAGLRNR